MTFIRRIVLTLLCLPALLQTQEVKFIDLSSTQQRTGLRHPLLTMSGMVWVRGFSKTETRQGAPLTFVFSSGTEFVFYCELEVDSLNDRTYLL